MTPIEKKIQEMRERLGVNSTFKASIETVQAACCAAFDVGVNDLLGRSLCRNITDARISSMAICYLHNKRNGSTAVAIAHKKCRESLHNAVRRVAALLETDKEFKSRFQKAEMLIKEFSQPTNQL